MTVSWKIINADRYVEKDGRADQINKIHFDVYNSETVDGVTHSGRYYGAVECPDPVGDFIAYADVTEENCLAWVKSLIGSQGIKAAEDSIALQISLSKNPVKKTGLPF